MAIHYRKYQEKDYIELKRMVIDFYEEDATECPISEEKIRKTADYLMKNPNTGTIFIFEENGEICGYCIIIDYWSNEFGGNILNIDEIYLKSQYRRTGFCSKFINELIDSNYHDLVAIMVFHSLQNTAANSFYRKNKFRKYDLLPLIYLKNLY